MLTRRRSLTAAAFGALLLTSPAAPLGAQTSNTVGPPVLENFQLPGQRTTPPAPEPQPATPPPAQTTTPPPATETPRPEPRAATPEPRRETPRPAPRTTTEAPAPAPAPALQAEAPAAQAPAPEVLPPARPAPPPVQTPAPTAEAPAAGTDWTWLYFAVPAALALLALLVVTRRRRAGEAEEELDYAESAPEPEAEAPAEALAPAPEPQPAAPIAAGPRPWLEIDITPERAVATDKEAVVHYELILRNTGNAPARNIRIDTKLFNASEEAQMNAFFAGPIHEQSGSPHIVIEPGSGLYLVGQVALPKEQVREVRFQDRSLFIPLVAMNVAYDWEGGQGGRTSKSWLVGREPQAPEAKMGAFRLDLGPRVYRSVAGREAKLVKV